MQVGRARPAPARLALFFAAYLAGAGFAKWLSLYPDTGISIWPPGGVFLAALLLFPQAQWPWWIGAALTAELVANALWFHNPPAVAVLINAGNALGAMLGAWLLRRIAPRVAELASLRSVLLLVLVGALLAPMAAATVGAATLAWAEGQPFAKAWPLWWIGDAVGVVVAAPLALVVAQAWRERTRVTAGQATEALAIALVLAAVTTLVFSGALPFAYVVLPVMIWAALRFEFRGSVAALLLLAMIAAYFTARGVGPFAADAQWQHLRYVMLQFFLGVCGITTLVIASITRQHRRGLRTLRAAHDELEQRVAERTAALVASADSLDRERERLAVALRAGGLGVYEWSVGDNRVWWSPETHALYGTDPATFVPSVESFAALLHADERESFWRRSDEATARGEVFTHEYRIVRPDGEVRWIFNRSHAARDAQGRVERITGVASDVTERRLADDALRDKDARLRIALEASSIGLWSWDCATDAVDWSPEIYRILGLAPGSLAPGVRAYLARIHADDRDRVRTAFSRSVETRALFEAEYRVLRPDGATVWIYDRGRVVLDGAGAVRGLVGAIADVTARKQYEQALAEASRAKDEFLAMLAHELRNPLAPIRNAADLLRIAAAGDPLVERAREMIERQVAHMVRLVDDLLDVSRVARGKITLQRAPVDLGAVLRQVVEAQRPQIEARRHEVSMALPPDALRVEGDFTRLVQVAGNLLANALRYTDPGGRIELSAEADEREGRRQAVVRVRDNGRGITPEAMAHLFEMFYQAESMHDRAEGGLGIGLALVRRLTELHGGTIEAHSAGRGHGSEFVLRLPLLPAAAAEGAALAPVRPRPVTARRILVVDDNRDAAESTALLLRFDGHEVHTAYDGREAVEAALRHRPAAVLLDLGLPSLNGYQACRAMRDGGLTEAVIIAVTGHGQDQDQRASAEAGFDGHQVKPVAPDQLRTLLAAHPRLATARRDATGA